MNCALERKMIFPFRRTFTGVGQNPNRATQIYHEISTKDRWLSPTGCTLFQSILDLISNAIVEEINTQFTDFHSLF